MTGPEPLAKWRANLVRPRLVWLAERRAGLVRPGVARRATGPVRRLLVESRPVAARLVVAAVLGAGSAGCAIGLTAVAAWLISRAAQHPPVLSLTIAIVGVRAFGLLRGFLRYGERLAGHDAALRALAVLRMRCYERLTRLVPGSGRFAGGDTLSRFASDVDAGLDVLVRVVLPYAAMALAAVATVAFLATLLPAAALVLAIALVAAGVAVPAVQYTLARRADQRSAPARGEVAARTVDLLHGLPDLVAYGAVDGRLAALRRADARLRRIEGRSASSAGLGSALVAVLGGSAVWVALVLGAQAVHSGRLDGVLLAVVVLTPLAVLDVLADLPAAAARLGPARSALRRVFAVLDAPDPTPSRSTQLPGSCGHMEPAMPQVHGSCDDHGWHLVVEGVAARWPGSDRDALTDVSLDLPPGRRVALVGPSGCGKSTLAALLVRFLDPVRGRVTLNHRDLRTMAGDEVRRVVGLVTEDAHCFDATVEANLRVARPESTSDELNGVLAAMRLNLPLDREVGEHGQRLSGGERRRLALARALLADFPILVVDEPTEHLDDETARAVIGDLLDATAGRTLLLITHRPYGLDRMDEVVSLLDRDAPAERAERPDLIEGDGREEDDHDDGHYLEGVRR